MSKDGTHNDLDNFLKESFEEHTIKPAPELWDKIESRFQPKVVPIQQYSKLKLALYTSIAVIAVLAVVLLFPEKELNQKPLMPEPPATEQLHEQKTDRIELPNSVAAKNTSPKYEEIEQLPSNENVAKEKTQKTEELVEIYAPGIKTKKYDNKLLPKLLTPVAFTIDQNDNENNLTSLNLITKKENTGNTNNYSSVNKKDNTSRRKSTKTRNNRSRKKHYASNKHLPRRKNYSNYSRKGKILDDLTFKLNLTPAVTQLIIADEDSDMPNYEHIEMDNPGLTLNGGIELEYQINDNWVIYTGLKTSYFKQTYEEHAYTVPSPFQDGQDLMTPAGKYLMKGDAEDVPNSVLLDASIKLRYLDIPFVARYQINNFFFDAGINYSYLVDNHSSLTPKNNSSSLLFEENGGFKEHAFGFIAGFGYKQTFNSGWRFEIGPELKFNVNNIYTGGEVTGVPIFVGFRSAFCLSRYYAE